MGGNHFTHNIIKVGCTVVLIQLEMERDILFCDLITPGENIRSIILLMIPGGGDSLVTISLIFNSWSRQGQSQCEHIYRHAVSA